MGCTSSKNKPKNIRHSQPQPYNPAAFNPYPLPDHPVCDINENNTFRLLTDAARKIYNPVGLKRYLTIPAGLKGVITTSNKELKYGWNLIDKCNIMHADGTDMCPHHQKWKENFEYGQLLMQGDTFQTIQIGKKPNVKSGYEEDATHCEFEHAYQILIQFDNIYEDKYIWLRYDITSLYDNNGYTSTQFERHCKKVMDEFTIDQINTNAVPDEQFEHKMNQRYTPHHAIQITSDCFMYQHPSNTTEVFATLPAKSTVWLVAPELNHIFPADEFIYVYVAEYGKPKTKWKFDENVNFGWIKKCKTNLLRDFWMKNDLLDQIVIGRPREWGYEGEARCYLEAAGGYRTIVKFEENCIVQLLSKTAVKREGGFYIKVRMLRNGGKDLLGINGLIFFVKEKDYVFEPRINMIRLENVDFRFVGRHKWEWESHLREQKNKGQKECEKEYIK